MTHARAGTRPGRAAAGGSRGAAIAEFALILPLLLLMVLGALDFGRLIQTRLILANVSREGGSIASREATLDTTITTMLLSSCRPLSLRGIDGRIIITRVAAGQSASAPTPTVSQRVTAGGLGVSSRIAPGSANFGLTRNVYNRLVFRTANGAADIAELTVVEVYYKYRPITPLPNMIRGLVADGGGVILWSRAVF